MKQSRSMFYTRKHRYLLESAPVTSDTSDRHCSFHPSLSPCHTMLRTFASTPRCCAARSKRRARSGRPALSAASMAALRTASNGDFLQLVVDQQRPIRQRHNFESFMIPGLFFVKIWWLCLAKNAALNRWMTRIMVTIRKRFLLEEMGEIRLFHHPPAKQIMHVSFLSIT